MLTTHQIPLARLDRSRRHDFRFVPDEMLCKQLAQEIEFRKISISVFEGFVQPVSNGADLFAKLKAQVVQNCVISNAPVRSDLNLKITRKYRKDLEVSEIDIQHEEDFDTDVELMPSNLELIDIIRESIILNTAEYPKLAKYLEKDEWVFVAGEEIAPEAEPKTKPFAGLSALKLIKNSDEE